MSSNREWLNNTTIRYNPSTASFYKVFTPVVVPVKKLLRKLFAFIVKPLTGEINEYHKRLLIELDAQRDDLERMQRATLEAQCNTLRDTLRTEMKAQYEALGRESEEQRNRLQAELAALNTQYQALQEMVHTTAGALKRFINEHNTYLHSDDKTVARVGPDLGAYFAVLDKRDTDPITLSLRSGNIDGVVETRLHEMFAGKGENFFVDLGANLGAFSLYMGAKGWRGCAFEASSHNANLLQKSVGLNGYAISVVNKAVSDYTGSLYFVSNGPWGVVVKHPEPQSEELSCTTMDDLLESTFKDIEKIDLIKIDIEGSEPAALRGMKNFLSRYRYPPIFMEINALTLLSFHETPTSLLKLANDLGYTAYTIQDNTLVPRVCSQFQTEVVIDVLLLKTIPAGSSYTVAASDAPDDEAIITWLAGCLADMATWSFDQMYLLYILQAYPQYYNDPRIYGHLKKGPIRQKQDEFPWIAHAADWIKDLA